MSTDRITIEVRSRGPELVGSRSVRRLRRDGLVPGVLYGKGSTRAIAVDERTLRAALTGPSGLNAILDVVIEGQKTPHHAVLKDYQQHPVRGTITHIDLHEVRLDQPIQATVIVSLVGESPGVKAGGQLQQVTRELNVEALPTAIPEHVDVELGTLEIGDVLRLEELPAVSGLTFLDPPDTVLVTISAPRGLEELEAEVVEGEAVEAAEGVEAEAAPEGEPEAAGE